MKQYLTWPPARRYLSSCSPSSQPRVLPVSRISYRLYQPAQTKRAGRNWVSHLLPDMIDKSLPSVISAKLLFRRAAAPSLPLLLLLIVLLTTGLPQPVSSFTAAVYGVSQTHRDKFYPRGNCTTSRCGVRFLSNRKISGGCNCENVSRREKMVSPHVQNSSNNREFSNAKRRWDFLRG